MSKPEFRNGMSAVSQAAAERARGRQRLKVTTAAVSTASLGVAGVVMVMLPGSSHASTSRGSSGAATSSPPKSSGVSHRSAGSSGDRRSSDNSGTSSGSSSSSNSSNLQAPSSAPTQSSGTPVSTSGGS